MPKKSSFADILKKLPPKTDPPDILKAMGPSILRIPFQLWEERFFFRGAPDTALREKTGRFPAKLGKVTHPVYLLRKIGNYGFQACPCTSKSQRGSYIRRGCILEYTNHEMDRDSYILEQMVFNLAKDDAFRREMIFWGRVPENCVATKADRVKRRGRQGGEAHGTNP